MRSVSIGGRDHTIAASPRTLLIYRGLDGGDIISDTMRASLAIAADPIAVDRTQVLQIAWAMAKTAAGSSPFPDFPSWLDSLDARDLGTLDVVAIIDEAARGFFRGAEGAAGEDAREVDE